MALTPIYIVSKGRHESRLTIRVMEYMKRDYFVVIEESDWENYASVVDPSRLLVLPYWYLKEYDTFWERGEDGKCGPGAARNFAWDHSIKEGHDYHWVMDDNLEHFFRLNRNRKDVCRNPAIFQAMEDFVRRYSNVALAAPNYESFAKATDRRAPYVLNTRVYSCILIRNDIPYRWRGRYNEDTDLSLRVLKDGWCTIQFNAFLQGKVTTQRISGGNTAEFYDAEGTKPKSQMLADMHPDVAKVVWKFNRWHHEVDYRAFKRNRLKFVEGVEIPEGVNEYGMRLVDIDPKTRTFDHSDPI